MKVVTTIASVETHERLVVELECGGDPILSLCRVTKESGEVNVEFDLRYQGGDDDRRSEVIPTFAGPFVESFHRRMRPREKGSDDFHNAFV